MTTGDKNELMAAALKAREHAVAPYSGFAVGAAVMADDGDVFTGANVESASYGLTCCAERVALFKALTAGKRKIQAVGVIARHSGGPMPCGACRQLMAEYAPNATVFVSDSEWPEATRSFTVRELLPDAFDGSFASES